jgi:galactokinase
MDGAATVLCTSMNLLPIRAFAPGRVNLIGEHTDYNDGLCLPFAVELGVTVTAGLRDGGKVEAPDLEDDDPYLRGALAELRAAGIDPPGSTLSVASDLPREAGLSSSAALCVALVMALCATAGAESPPAPELARICSRIESDYTGAETGLLDQLASLLGREGHALRLDMRTFDTRPIGLDLGGHVLAVVDSGAHRSIARSGYNERREECRRAAELLGVASLRDALGELLDASHASLRDDYEVSVPEVERAVAACRDTGALGARLMGGGFGGSVLALFPPAAHPPAGAIRVGPGPGARLLC